MKILYVTSEQTIWKSRGNGWFPKWIQITNIDLKSKNLNMIITTERAIILKKSTGQYGFIPSFNN